MRNHLLLETKVYPPATVKTSLHRHADKSRGMKWLARAQIKTAAMHRIRKTKARAIQLFHTEPLSVPTATPANAIGVITRISNRADATPFVRPSLRSRSTLNCRSKQLRIPDFARARNFTARRLSLHGFKQLFDKRAN